MNTLNTAFVPSAGVAGLTSSSFRGIATTSRRPTRSIVVSPRATLANDDRKKAFVTPKRGESESAIARRESEYRGPQGFTAYAEKVNGRMAQLGFVIGLVTEIASGKTIGEQMEIMFSPLLSAAHAAAVLGASAAHHTPHLLN